jgi:hypothetical protein
VMSTAYQVQCRHCETNAWNDVGPKHEDRSEAKELLRYHFHNGVDRDSLRIVEVEGEEVTP